MKERKEERLTYFFGGMCAGVGLCYVILWSSLNLLQ